jgi:hypothetical protein
MHVGLFLMNLNLCTTWPTFSYLQGSRTTSREGGRWLYLHNLILDAMAALKE